MANVLLKMAGHRKATMRYCNECQEFHRTHRHPDGEQRCPVGDFTYDSSVKLIFTPGVISA